MNNPFKHSLLTFAQTLFAIVISVAVISCGGSSSGSPAGGASTLSGTAATGIALDGVVNVYGSNGGEVLDVPTDASGNYTADVSGLTPPFCVCAVPTDTSLDTQYSYASGAGIANITPLTTLTLFYANGEQDPAPLIANWPAEATTVLANIPNAQALVNANFDGIFSAISATLNTDFTTYDFASTQFAIGDTFDQILDLLTIDVTAGGVPVITVNGTAFPFDSNIDISGVDIGGTGSTGGTSGTGTASGALQITGAGASLLPIASTNFNPNAVINDGNGLLFTWGDLENTLVQIALHPTIPGQVGLISVANGLNIWTIGNGFTAVPGASFSGSTVTFVGVTVPTNPSGGSSLILTGALTE